MTINTIIFSKNRSTQLELLIRSLKTFWMEFSTQKIQILYTFSDPKYEEGYKLVQQLHPEENIHWVKESNFKADLRKMFNLKETYSIFFVDDNVMKEEFTFQSEEFKLLEEKKDLACLSLRLGPHLNYCYTVNKKMKTPSFEENYLWDWTQAEHDFAYPCSLDAHIFRTSDIFQYFYQDNYFNPNSLESFMASKPINKKYMNCYEKSKVFNLPMNKVQDYNNNRHGKISEEFLNEKFLQGERISLKNISHFLNTSCHQEINLECEEF